MTAPLTITVELTAEQLQVIAEHVAAINGQNKYEAKAEPWLTVEQAAAHLAMSTSQIYTLTSQRQIPVVKQGTRSYFKASELDAWRRAEGQSR